MGADGARVTGVRRKARGRPLWSPVPEQHKGPVRGNIVAAQLVEHAAPHEGRLGGARIRNA